MKWIKIDEKYPEFDEYVLFMDRRRDDGYRHFVGSLGSKLEIRGPSDFDIYLKLKDVTHWMPLPPDPSE